MSNTLPSELDSIQPSFGLPAFPKKEQPVFTDSAVPFQSDFLAASQRYGVPVNVIMGLAEQESSFNPKALGVPTAYGRAKGIMQYIDSTASRMGINPYDPVQSIDAAAKQLRERLDKGYTMEEAVKAHFAGDDRKQWGPKTAAYGQEVLARAEKFLSGNFTAPAQTVADVSATPEAVPGQAPAFDTQAIFAELNAEEPDRYRPLTEEEMKRISQHLTPELQQDALSKSVPGVPIEINIPEVQAPGEAVNVQPEQPKGNEEGNLLTDTGYLLASGLNSAAKNLRELVGKVPYVGKSIVEASDRADQWLNGKSTEEIFKSWDKTVESGLTPEMLAARKKAFVIEPGDKLADGKESTGYNFGPAWSDPRTYMSGIVESLPEMAVTMGGAGRLAQLSYKSALKAGATKEAAAKAAARTATVAGGVLEGAFAGASTSRNVRDQILQMDPEQLKDSTVLADLMEQGKSFEQARAELAENSASQAFLIAGVATGMFGGLGDRALVKIITDNSGGRIKGALKGMLGEGFFEELPQSSAQQLAENYAMQDADPSRPLDKGVANAAAQGLAIGSVMGGGLGAIAPKAGDQQPAERIEPTIQQDPAPKGPLSSAVDEGVKASADAMAKQPVSEAAPAADEFMGPVGGETLVVPADDPNEKFNAKVVAYRNGNAVVEDANGERYELSPTEVIRPDVQPVKEAEQPAAEPVQAAESVQTPEPLKAADKPLDQMSEPELRNRLKYVNSMGKQNGWDKRLTTERKIIESAIDSLATKQPQQEQPAEEQPVKWFGSADKANGFIQKKNLGDTHEVVPVGNSRFEIREKQQADKTKSPHFQRSTKLVGPEGAVLSPSMDIGQAKAGGKYVVEKIDKDGTVHLGDQVTNALIKLTRQEIEKIRPSGIKWDSVASTVVETPKAQPEQQQDEWQQFPSDSGSLGIPRSDMPQVKAEHRGAMVNYLNARGVAHTEQSVSADSLKPTQGEYSTVKVQKAKEYEGGNRSILVSADGYVLDGHHQWMAAKEQGQEVKVIRLDAPITDLIDMVKEFPSSTVDTASATANQPADDHLTEKGVADKRLKVAAEEIGSAIKSGDIPSTVKSFSELHDFIDANELVNDADRVDRVIGPLGKKLGWGQGDYIGFTNKLIDSLDSWIASGMKGSPANPFDVEAAASSSKAVQDFIDGKRPDAPTVEEVEAETSTDSKPVVSNSSDQAAVKQSPETDTAPQSVQDAPAQPAFSDNKIFTADKVAAARERIRSKLGQLNSGIDPEMLVDGMTIAGAYIESGVRKFSEYAKLMTADLGEGVKPYLLSFWEGARNYPGLDIKGMTSTEDSAKEFAALLKPADLKTEAVGTVDKKPATRTRKTGASSDITLTNDWGVDHIDGYGENSTGAETGSDLKTQFLKETEKYLKAVADELEKAGFGSYLDVKGRPRKTVMTNPAGDAVSGDVMMSMAGPNGVGAYVSIGGTSMRGTVPVTQSGVAILYRGSSANDHSGSRYPNRWAPVDLSAADLAKLIMAEVAREEARNEPKQLDEPSKGPLAGASADPVQPAESERETKGRTEGGSDKNLSGAEPAGGSGVSGTRSVGNGAGAVSVPKGRSTGPRNKSSSAENAGSNEADARPAAGLTADELPDSAFNIDADAIGKGGAKTKYKNNVAAIRILKQLQAEGRQATRQEQEALSLYVGWGGIPQAFERTDGSASSGWDKEVKELKELLTTEEYEAAEQSTRNAHYTSPQIVSAMWRAVERMGFTGGKLIEPSVGVGNFFGLMPADIRAASALHGVELDKITAGLAANLYPEAKIANMGFQEYNIPDGYFDLAIGNPPFGAEKLYDGKRKHLSGFSIHNYFFARSVDALRPGGVLAMVVTNRFMDGTSNKAAREYIAERANLIGAIRLPNDAFSANAGTEVTTDIIFLQRREDGTPRQGASWLRVEDYKDKSGKTVPLNQYFVQNPNMMLGEFGAYGTMYRPDDSALVKREGQDTAALLEQALNTLPERIMTAASKAKPETRATVSAQNVRVGSVYLDGDKVMIKGDDVMGESTAEAVEFPNEKAKQRVVGMIGIRDVLTDLRKLQLDPRSDAKRMNGLRKKLNQVYDDFVKEFGHINSDANKRLMRDDPTWPQLSALEDSYDKGVTAAVSKTTGEAQRAPSAKKAAIFSTRTQTPYRAPESASSAKDALITSLSETGRVNLAYMSELYSKPQDQIIQELGPLIFQDPTAGWVTRDAYLSGNVKAKLAKAKDMAATDPAYNRNVEALEEVQPKDVEAVDISIKPGASWIPANDMRDFAIHLGAEKEVTAFYDASSAKWSFPNLWAAASAESRFGTGRMRLKAILEAAASQKAVQVYDTSYDGKRTLNETETQLANDKVNLVKEEFARWVWESDDRRTRLTRIYNDMFNTDVSRDYDGSHLTLPGKTDTITLRPHQNNAIWRIIQSGTTLTDHVVGAGKTFTLIGAAMELRRMGLANKPLFAVPNHLVAQWAADFVKLYPGANILAATKRDFEKENRKRLFARIATGDWDAVIVAHSSFGKVQVDPESESEFIREQIKDLTDSIEAIQVAEGKSSRNVKQAADRRKKLEERLKRLTDIDNKDDSLYWSELGIDALFLDEAHEFKNLAYSTSMRNVAGLGSMTGSQKAMDLFMKVRQVLKTTGGRNVVFATGTPISNTMAEMYTMQRYLDYDTLKQQGLAHFDAWARMFGEVVSDWELSPSGSYKLNSRFAKFVNMPELMQRYTSFADVINRDDINRQLAAQGKRLPVPKVKTGKPINQVVERSNDQAMYIGVPTVNENGVEVYPDGSLVYRAENLPKKAEKGSDNMLKIMSDARKAALDMRLINPSYPDHPGSKTNVAADNILTTYKEWDKDKGTQLVFIDLSTPKASKAEEAKRIRDLIEKAENGDEAAAEELDKISPDELSALDSDFSVYDDLRQKLIDRGIPAEEIAFIHSAKTDIQKGELFAKVKSGRIRVLFGSTAKMGAGMNVQDRLVALHHLDAPWRPSDLEQREGRIIRQGNTFYDRDPEGFEVGIYRYATKQTLDSRMWQTLESKARFIEQVRKGNTAEREVEDIGGEAANSAEMKAASSGNPLILEEMSLRQQIRKLENERQGFARDQHRIRDRISFSLGYIKTLERKISELESDAKLKTPESFAVKIEGVTYTKRADAGAALLAAAADMERNGSSEREIGKYGDFTIHMERTAAEQFLLHVTGSGSYTVRLNIGDDPQGLSMRLTNSVSDLGEAIRKSKEQKAELESDAPKLQKQLSTWGKIEELEKAKARHAEVLDQLKPKKAEKSDKAEDPKAPPKEDVRYSAEQISSTPSEGMQLDQVQAIADKIVSEFTGDMPLSMIITQTQEELYGPAATEQGIYIKGAYHPERNAFTLIADNLDNPRDVRKTIIHEFMAHYGLDTFDAESRQELLQKVIDSRGTKDKPGTLWPMWDKISSDPFYGAKSEIIQAEEVFAHTAETTEGKFQEFFDSIRGLIIRALRKLGLIKSPLTNTEIRQVIRSIAQGIRNGSRSKQSQYDEVKFSQAPQIGTEAFKRWFGDSKVVDESGNPLVVYHGTSSEFSEFNNAENGMFFSDNKEIARRYGDRDPLAVYLSMQKPLEINAGFNFWNELDYINDKNLNELQSVSSRKIKTLDHLKSAAAAAGYDGVIVKNVADNSGVGTQYIAFSPEQIKSATGNDGTFDPANPDIRFSQRPANKEVDSWIAQKWEATKELTGDALTSVMPALLHLTPGRTLLTRVGKDIPALAHYADTKLKMDTFRDDWHAITDKLAQRWQKYRIMNSKENSELMDLMHESTLRQVDPSKPFMSLLTEIDEKVLAEHQPDTEAYEAAAAKAVQDAERQVAYDELKARFDKLSREAKNIYHRVRDTYKKLADTQEQIVLDNIERALGYKLREAQRKHEEELQRIKDEGLKGSEKDEAIEKADKALANAARMDAWNKRAKMNQFRSEFESNRLAGPYFPLSRFGDFFVTARNKDTGEVEFFSRQESARDQTRVAKELKQRGYDVETGFISKSADLRKQIPAEFVATIEELLKGVPGTEETQDQVWQLFLERMPDISIRKNRIHRKGRAGFEEDALRAFASHMFHGAHQTAKLKYSMALEDLLDEAKRQVKNTRNPTRSGMVLEQANKSHQYVMNPTSNAISQIATQGAFIWYLAQSPAAALLNMAQTVIVGPPKLAAFYDKGTAQGIAMAVGQINRALFDLANGKTFAENSPRVTPEEKAAVAHAYRVGLITRTQSHDVAGIADSGIKYSPIRAKIMAGVSWMFHHTERVNREATFLAAYRVAKKKGLQGDNAIHKAMGLTWDIHYDYQNTSRPPIMHSNTGKALLVFRNYSLNMISDLAYTAYEIINPRNAQERREARTQMVGLLGTLAFNAGIRGLPLYGIMMVIAGMFSDDGEDPEVELKKSLLEYLPPSMVGMMMDGVPGYTLGVEISGRIGFGDLWFRSDNMDKEGDSEYLSWLQQVLGAASSIPYNIYKGINQINEGYTWRGMENILPKMIKDPMKSWRYVQEGVTTKNGDPIVDEVGGWDIFKQAIGVTPARIAEQHKMNSYNMNKQKSILDQRSKLLTDFYKAWKAGEDAEQQKILDKMQAYSQEYPEMAIDSDAIRQSLKRREKYRGQNVGGMNYNPNLLPRLQGEQPGTVYR